MVFYSISDRSDDIRHERPEIFYKNRRSRKGAFFGKIKKKKALTSGYTAEVTLNNDDWAGRSSSWTPLAMTVLDRVNNHRHSHMQKEKASLDDLRVFVAQNNCPGKSTLALNQRKVRGRTNLCRHFLVIDAAIKWCSSIAFCTVDSGAFDAHSSIELNYERFIMSKIILLALFAMVAMTAILAAPMEGQ